MRSIILILTLFSLVGCGNPIGFTESGQNAPVWYTDSQSPENEGRTSQNQQIVPEQIIQKQIVQKQIVHQQIVHQQIIQQDKPCDDEQSAVKDTPPAVVKAVERENTAKASPKPVPKSKPVPKLVLAPKLAPAPKPAPTPKKVDIVIIVDTSFSMNTFLRNVEQSFKDFIPALSSLDWRIFFTNADHGNNGLFLLNGHSMRGKVMSLEYNGKIVQNIKYLSKAVQDHEVVFLDTLRVHGNREFTQMAPRSGSALRRRRSVSKCHLPPYCQSWNEQPLKSLNSALVENEEYFRADADIVAIIISDSDEGAGVHSSKRITAEMVRHTFAENHQDKNMITYGILMIDRECQQQYGKGFSDEDKFSFEVSNLARSTGGTNYSLCENNYAPLARQIVFDFQH